MDKLKFQSDHCDFFLDNEGVSSRTEKEIEIGLEVEEETYVASSTEEAAFMRRRLPSHKSVAASIAAAQAVLTNTLSPSSHRKKKSVNISVVGDIISQSDSNSNYSFGKEMDQIMALGI